MSVSARKRKDGVIVNILQKDLIEIKKNRKLKEGFRKGEFTAAGDV